MSNWVRGLRQFAFAAFTFCVALALSSLAAHGQGFEITNLTKNTSSKASFPTMVVDSQGNLNLVWIDSVKGLQFARSASSAAGTSFGTPPTITTIKGPKGEVEIPSFQPQLAVYMTQPNAIEITWAVPAPASTLAAPLYDVWASRSNDSGANFTTSPATISGAVALFDSPRLAFDFLGRANIVWGQTGVWISQAQDGIHFGTPISLVPVTVPPTPPNTGGPRIAVSAADNIFVVWTDEANKTAQNSYCTSTEPPPGTPVPNTVGGNFWVNETLPGQATPAASNTRNLSTTDWVGVNSRFPHGFFGCSSNNLNLFADKFGLIHFLWSDDSPTEDVLASEPHGTYPAGSPFAGETQFSFPINLASHSAASPDVAVDKNGSFYVVWSGGPGPGAESSSQGIFFSRSDDGGSTFTNEVNVAPSGSVASAFPRISVDSRSNVNIVWEQPTKALAGDGSDLFNVFFARSTDKGNTFPTVLQVSANPSVLCFKAPPPPQGTGGLPTSPDVSTCGTVQIGVDANSSPDMAWVNQAASGSAVPDIDFATTIFPTGSVAPTSASLSPSSPSAAFTVTVNASGFSGPITFSCLNADSNSALPSWLSCGFAQQPLNPSQSNTDTLTITRVGTPTSGMFISAPSSHSLPPNSVPLAWTVGLAAVWLMCMAMLAMGRRRELDGAVVMRSLVIMTLTVVLAAGLVSCGGSTSTTSTTGTTATGATGTTGSSGSGGTGGTGGAGGTGGTGDTGGTGGTGGGSSVTMHVAVVAQSGGAAPTNLGTVTITAQ